MVKKLKHFTNMSQQFVFLNRVDECGSFCCDKCVDCFKTNIHGSTRLYYALDYENDKNKENKEKGEKEEEEEEEYRTCGICNIKIRKDRFDEEIPYLIACPFIASKNAATRQVFWQGRLPEGLKQSELYMATAYLKCTSH